MEAKVLLWCTDTNYFSLDEGRRLDTLHRVGEEDTPNYLSMGYATHNLDMPAQVGNHMPELPDSSSSEDMGY